MSVYSLSPSPSPSLALSLFSLSLGMSSAVMHLGLHDCFDVVLGSSAGSIIGTYLLGSEDPAQHRENTYQVLRLLALLVQKYKC